MDFCLFYPPLVIKNGEQIIPFIVILLKRYAVQEPSLLIVCTYIIFTDDLYKSFYIILRRTTILIEKNSLCKSIN